MQTAKTNSHQVVTGMFHRKGGGGVEVKEQYKNRQKKEMITRKIMRMELSGPL